MYYKGSVVMCMYVLSHPNDEYIYIYIACELPQRMWITNMYQVLVFKYVCRSLTC